jgi:hypothetical protein
LVFRSGKSKYSNVKIRTKLIFLLLLTGLLAYTAHAQSLSVIANQKGSPTGLSASELKSVFMGEKQRWPNGTKVFIALIKTNNPLGELVCQKVFNMKPDELNKYWLALVFQGKASAPTFFNSVGDLQTFVAQTPGAISIIDQSVSTTDIKTLTIDGKRTL